MMPHTSQTRFTSHLLARVKGLEPLTYWFVVLHYIHFCDIYA